MLPGLGPTELIIILLIILVLFGPRFLKGIAPTIKELRKIGKEIEDNKEEKDDGA